MSVQIIDEDKKFTPELSKFLAAEDLINRGLQYHTVAVFGSQSSGKSTLLNQLFNTEFDVMNTQNRRQTTHGIWLGSQTRENEWPIVVLDVEGTDGRERGDDQDFERKAALFALATSEVLVVNMWENQIGLYLGSNMALLRTVFEVNLSLFQTGKEASKRSKIMFVVRDYSGLTPADQLSATLREDLDKQWETIAKPAEQANSKIADFFDVDYAFLPHKVYKPEEFVSECNNLRSKIGQAFNNNSYHRNVPIDGWPVYASQVWQKIEDNKDLDLPSHHMLVAKFRCEELSNESFAQFVENCAQIKGLGGAALVESFGEQVSAHFKTALDSFDGIASRYNQQVYQAERESLLLKLQNEVSPWFTAQMKAVLGQTLSEIKTKLANAPKSVPFVDRLQPIVKEAHAQFDKYVDACKVEGLDLSIGYNLDSEIDKLCADLRLLEFKKIVKQATKQFQTKLDEIDSHLQNDDLEFPWKAVEETLNKTNANITAQYPPDLGLGGSEEELNQLKLQLEVLGWQVLQAKVANLTKPDTVLQFLREKFDVAFKYTDDGLPIVWNPTDDVDSQALKARTKALSMLPKFASANCSDEKVLSLPPHVAQHLESNDEEIFEFDDLLTSQQQKDIEQRFQRYADQAYVEAKRSMMHSNTRIPSYIFVLLIVLGWNEMMMVLRNPLLLVLVIMLGSGFYVSYYLGMSGPLLLVVQRSVEQTLETVKQLIRDFANSEPKKISEQRESSPEI